MITVGIDPDSTAHGVAVFEDQTLISLHNFQLFDVLRLCLAFDDVFVSMEHTLMTSAVYTRNKNANRRIQDKIAVSIGRCQQSQTELARAFERHNIKYVLHNPTKSNWAKNKEYFERMTGWNKRSNEDNRSAAYFGFIESRGKRNANISKQNHIR